MTVRKGFTRHDMKQDELVSTMSRVIVWTEENSRQVGFGLVAVALLVVAGFVVNAWMRSRAEEAYRRLAKVQKTMETPLGAPAEPGQMSFATPAERSQEIIALAEGVIADYPRSQASTWARYYRAVALADLGRPEEALTAADEVAQRADGESMLEGLALMLAGQIEEARSNLDRAVERYSQAAAIESAGFPPEFALLRKAGCLDQLGRTPEAVEAYEKVVSDYPNSPLAARASQKLRELRGEGMQGL